MSVADWPKAKVQVTLVVSLTGECLCSRLEGLSAGDLLVHGCYRLLAEQQDAMPAAALAGETLIPA